MTKEQIKKELENVKELYVVGNEAWTKFDVYYVRDGRLVKLWIDSEEEDTPSLWVKRHVTKRGNWVGGYFQNDVIGSNRTYEIGLSIARWLYNEPYKFKVINLYFTK